MLTPYFPQLVVTFQDTLCRPCRKLRDRSLSSLESGSTIGSILVVMPKDRLRKVTFIAKYSYSILILKSNKACLNIRLHRIVTLSFLMTLDLLDIFYKICRLLSL